MKVHLVVTAAGANNGKSIPIVGAKFTIGRDPQCNLRPASQAISNKHCAILIRDGKVFVEDYGSTNGTLVDGEAFTGERELQNGSALKIGPLEFRVEISILERKSDSTPLPEALKPLGSEAAAKLAAAVGQPAPTKKPASTPASPKASGAVPTPPARPSSTTPAAKPAPVPVPVPVPAASQVSSGDPPSSDDIDAAAMLLGMEDDASPNPTVPDGSTVQEMPAIGPDGTPIKKEEPKKKAVVSGAQMSAAANDILRKYIRRTDN